MTGGNASLLRSGKYSDLSIRCEEVEWKVHRAIVCSGSLRLSTLYDEASSEGSVKVINLSEDQCHIIHRVIVFLYTNEFSTTPIQATTQPDVLPFKESDESASIGDELLLSVQVYDIAIKYGIPELKLLAVEKFDALVRSTWPIQDFDNILEEIHLSNLHDADLRVIVNDICARHLEEIVKDPGIKAVFMEYSDFGLGVLLDVAKVHAPHLYKAKAYDMLLSQYEKLSHDLSAKIKELDEMKTGHEELSQKLAEVKAHNEQLSQQLLSEMTSHQQITKTLTEVQTQLDIAKPRIRALEMSKNQLTNTQSALNITKNQVKEAEKKANNIQPLYNHLWKLVSVQKTCRHCKQRMTWVEYELQQFVMRCGDCTTRNY